MTEIVRPIQCACGERFANTRSLGTHARACAVCTQEFRFWLRVDRSGGPDACWPWTGAITSKWHYGCTQWQGRVLGAHKVAWVLTNGPVPDGLCVLHKCDNRPCCNPKHHFLGTKTDNMADCKAKKRHVHGERNFHAILTEKEVLQIRAEYRSDAHGYRSNAAELAARYGVKVPSIKSVVKRRSWRHL